MKYKESYKDRPVMWCLAFLLTSFIMACWFFGLIWWATKVVLFAIWN